MTDKIRILTNQETNSVRITKNNEIIISVPASEVTVQHFKDGSVCYSPAEKLAGTLLPCFEYEKGVKYKHSDRLKCKLGVLKAFDDEKEDEGDDDVSSYKGETGVTKDWFSYTVISTSEANNDLTVRFTIDKSTLKLSLEDYKAGFNYKDRLKNIKEGDYITIPYFKKKCKITRITKRYIYFFSDETSEIHRVSKAQLEKGLIPDKLFKRMTKDRE